MTEQYKMQDQQKMQKQYGVPDRYEKFHTFNYEEYPNSSDISSQEGPREPEVTPQEEKKIKRKMDIRLVTLVGFMYCVSLMDRTNLANAKQAGMAYPRKGKYIDDQGLDLKGFRYNIMSLVFFPTYIIFQIPSTVIVRSLGPRIHLSTITLLWGSVMIGMAFVNDWVTMSGMRVILGALEAGFFPSCVYLLSTWYTRYDMGKRYSLFYILGCVASAFAGVLAFAIMDLKGKLHLAGWRWIFLIEGLITVVIAAIGFIFLVGFPDHWQPSWHFLSRREVNWVIDKVNADRGDAKAEPFSMKLYLKSALDWKIWCYAMIFFDTTTISYALAYFLPEILGESLGYTPKMTQVMTAPPYIFAGFVMFVAGWAGDKFRIRGPIIAFNMLLCLIGIPLLGWSHDGRLRYFGVFLVTAGANANVPTVMTYQANNIRGQWKRAFCSATLVGFGGIGGISGSLVFRSQDKPTGFKPGLYACLACSGLNVLIVTVLSLVFMAENRKSRAGKKMLEGSKDFLYTI